jgi:hypothetical protein
LSPSASPILLVIFKIGSHRLFPGLASNWTPPDLCLLNRQDYMHGPPVGQVAGTCSSILPSTFLP